MEHQDLVMEQVPFEAVNGSAPVMGFSQHMGYDANGNVVPLDNSWKEQAEVEHQAQDGHQALVDHHPFTEQHAVAEHHNFTEHHTVAEHHTSPEHHTVAEHHTFPEHHTVAEHHTFPEQHAMAEHHVLVEQHPLVEQRSLVEHHAVTEHHAIVEHHTSAEQHALTEQHTLPDQHGLVEQHGLVDQHGLSDQHGLINHHALVEQHGLVDQHLQVEQQLPVEEQAPVEQPQVDEPPAPLTEEDRLWEAVTANSADFNAWTLLIQETEKLENIIKVRKVYDAFLAEFPLCYGYWKKYTDHEARLGSPEKIPEVFERAVQAVTYSVDIWMHYSVFAMGKFEDPDDIRRLFERGLSYVGTDYLSHLLWDKYIEFENSQNELSRVAQIYTRILQLPIQQLDRYYSGFKNLVATHSLQELRTPEENEAALASESEAGGLGDVAASEMVDVGSLEGEAALKPDQNWQETAEFEKFVGIRDALYKAAKDQDAKIRDFEVAIRRPYFHVKALDDLQLGNWHRYLDFVEKEGDFEKIVKLYERCLIACANYPEYWIRYVQHMDYLGSVEYASDALNRATQIFVKRRPEIHIFAARFKELQGDIEGARAEYELLNSGMALGLVEAVVKSANFEQRQGNMEGACSIFESAIELEKSRDDSRSLAFLSIQYSRFLDQVALNVDKAREVIAAALELLPSSKILWEAAILFESFRQRNKAVDYWDTLVEQALMPIRPDGLQGLSAADREEISSIFLEFIDLCGDMQAIRKADSRHRLLFPLRRSTSESKKRPSDSNTSDRVKMHKPSATSNPATSPTQSGPPVYANGQAQWGAVYGSQGYTQQPQGWQQAAPQQPPQVQPQQWNSGYTSQQAGYGSYGTYGIPQQQAPPPQQQPAYSGYAQSYAPQAFPQQSYAQPAPAYTAQQQAPAQQGYYGYY